MTRFAGKPNPEISQNIYMPTIKTKNIVFITGAFVTNACWDEWRIYFESKGYSTIAPPWPYKNGTAAELRAEQPNDIELATLTFKELVDHIQHEQQQRLSSPRDRE